MSGYNINRIPFTVYINFHWLYSQTGCIKGIKPL